MSRSCSVAGVTVARNQWMMGRRRRLGALAFPFLAFAAVQAGAGQDTSLETRGQETIGDDSRISVDVNLVVLHATVSDRRGEPVSGLQKQNFVVYEDGVPQPIRVFEQEDVPVTAGLVVDHSGSMRRKLAEVSAAARTFVELSNPKDQMFVVNFNEHVSLGLPKETLFSASSTELELSISQCPCHGHDGAIRCNRAGARSLKGRGSR